MESQGSVRPTDDRAQTVGACAPTVLLILGREIQAHNGNTTGSQPARWGELVIGTGVNKAEVEYAVMLAVLEFQTEFMKSNYSRVQVQVFDELIEVTLTRNAPIPAEEELAKSPGGQTLLRQFHQALFDSCRELLRAKIERAIGAKVESIISDLDLTAGKSTLLIRGKYKTGTF